MPPIDDLEADIAAAFRGETPAAPVVETPEEAPLEGMDAAPEGETAAERQARIDATGRAHDEKGRFTNKDKPEADPSKPPPVKLDGDKTADTKPVDGALQPPKNWSAQAKAEFLNAPRALQEQALKREEEIEKARTEWSGKAEDYNRIHKVIAPHLDKWARDGMTPDRAISQLISAANTIQQNPAEGIAYILNNFVRGQELPALNAVAQAYGYTLAKANNQGGQPQQGQQDPRQADPTMRRLEELERRTQQQEAEKAEAAQQQMISEVAAVRNDTKNVYFDNVRSEVALLAQAAVARGDTRDVRAIVQEAYDKACWANDEVRALMLADQTRKAAEAQRETDRKKVEAAKRAAGSINGSPGNGAPAPRTNGATHSRNLDDDIMGDIRNAMSAVRA